MIDLNPISVLKERSMNFMPIHFSQIKIERSLNSFELLDWIKTKLRGRFCVIDAPALGIDQKLKIYTMIGFEDQKELTYFMLACPFYRR